VFLFSDRIKPTAVSESDNLSPHAVPVLYDVRELFVRVMSEQMFADSDKLRLKTVGLMPGCGCSARQPFESTTLCELLYTPSHHKKTSFTVHSGVLSMSYSGKFFLISP